MTPFEIATGLLVLGGIAGAAWTLWPVIRGEAEPDGSDDPPDDGESDWMDRLRALVGQGDAEDEGLPWTERHPMLADVPRRIPADLVPWDVLPLVVHDGEAWLLPLGSALLRVPAGSGPIVRGRRHGRAFHVVCVGEDVGVDLVELVRLVPVLAAELRARGIDSTEIGLYADVDGFSAATGLGPDAIVGAIAPWLVGDEAPRVVPEGEGVSTVRWTLGDGALEVRSWTPAVARGIARDRLAWAGVASWTRDGRQVVDAGATSLEVLTAMGVGASIRASSLETWRWSRDELLELAGVGHHLEREGIDVTALVDDAFADRTVPVPSAPDDALVATAVLNWRAVVLRRAGRTRDAVAALDAALSICAPDDDDNRADILYNRGYARLQGLMSGPPVAAGSPESELHQAGFVEIPPPEALHPALGDFEQASRLNPSDPHAWSQQAVVHQLLGDARKAEDCWLQAATRTKDTEAHVQLLQNARAARDGAVPST